MISVACDKCDHVFEVDDAAAGGKVSCPECGDVNRVGAEIEAAVEVEAAQDAADGAADPHTAEAAGLATLGIGGVVLAFLAAATDSVPEWLAWPGLFMMLGAAAWWFAWYVSACLWVKLRISNKRCIRREGIIRRHTSEVLHDHVRNVEIKQSFVQRVFDVGYLGISSSGQDGIEIEILDIPRPNRVKALIDEYRDDL